jgi:E-phenylitaconyl-CoA hydratase
MDAAHYADMSRTWIEVRDDSKVRVAVVTGVGDRAFTAGADIKSYLTSENVWSDVWLPQCAKLLNRVVDSGGR